MVSMHVSARVDYALRAAVELAAAPDGSAVKPLDAQCQHFEITHSGVLLQARQPS